MQRMILATSLLFVSAAPAVVSAHHVRQDPPKQEAPKPVEVYDEKADGKADIAAALVRAKRENRRVLVQWGANWCVWCKLLHELTLKDKDVAKTLRYEYDVVRVDIGKWDKHAELAASYGADLKKYGVPFLTVLDADGKVLANQETGSLELEGEVQAHDPKKVIEFLVGHQAPHLEAAKVLDLGLARARSEGKLAFVHIGAPWCGWCGKLERWMDQADVRAKLGKGFVDVKLDQDRMLGAKELQAARFPESVKLGLPWFAFVDGAGKLVATSTFGETNTGFPVEPAEIAHFRSMLQQSGSKLSTADIDVLIASLEKSALEIKSR